MRDGKTVFQHTERTWHLGSCVMHSQETACIANKEFKSKCTALCGDVELYDHKNQKDVGKSVAMNFTVILPNGKVVQMDIDGSTPMMDVLIHVTSKNGMNAGGMILKVPSDKPPGYLHYKPNTPIGVLNCTTLEVVPKRSLSGDKPWSQMPKMAVHVEPSIRIQVDLPQKQKTVLRVHPQTQLSEILKRVCDDANLDPSQNTYELRGAKSHGYPLNLDLRLADVGTVDFQVVACPKIQKAQSEVFGTLSSTKSCRQKEERRKDGCFRSLFSRRKKKQSKAPSELSTIYTTQESAVITPQPWSLPIRFITPTPSEYEIPSEPSPPAPMPPIEALSMSKKRPAPPPPSQNAGMRTSSESTSGYQSRLLPSPGYIGMDQNGSGSNTPSFSSNFHSFTPNDSIRTAISSSLALSRPESMRSDITAKKRRAPPPPVMELQNGSASLTVSTCSLATEIHKNSKTDSLASVRKGLSISKLESNNAIAECEMDHKPEFEQFHCSNANSDHKSSVVTDHRGQSMSSPKSSVSNVATKIPIALTVDCCPQKLSVSKQRLYSNATCQTEPSNQISVRKSGSLSPRCAIVVTADDGKAYTPQMRIKSFEDEYYAQFENNDYARTIRYGTLDRDEGACGQPQAPAENQAIGSNHAIPKRSIAKSKYAEPAPAVKRATFQNTVRIGSMSALNASPVNDIKNRVNSNSDISDHKKSAGVPPAPPPVPTNWASTGRLDSGSSKNQVDGRVDLMKSIRDFGGTNNLKKLRHRL